MYNMADHKVYRCYPTTKPPENCSELFVAINCYLDYAVSNKGRVKNVHTDEILETKISRKGHVSVALFKHDKFKTHLLHHLVAHEFVKHPPGNLRKWFVEHIDGDTTNNNANNLRWMPIPGTGASPDDWKKVEWVQQHELIVF